LFENPDLKKRYPNAETFTFGDNRELCGRLLGLVRSGAKRATCDDLRVFSEEAEPMPVVGGYYISLNWGGIPALVIKTTEVRIMAFKDVDEVFALAEGENSSLEGWRKGHRAYFERNLGFDPDMKLVCERFDLIEVLAT